MRPDLTTLLCSLVAALIAASAATARAEPTPTLLIVDGSGSMWGNPEGERQSKFDLTRAAIRQVLASGPLRGPVGLMSFGHRRKSDCSDVELIAPPEAGPPERILDPVDKLNPRGKGPLTLALKEAAKTLGTSGPATIVVIHDGVDNCQQDPCAASEDLARANPRLAIHVVSIGLEKLDTARVSCIAKNTNGRWLEARDAASIGQSISEALKLANLDQGPPVTPEAAPQAAMPAEEGPPVLEMTASLGAGAPALDAAVAWRVWRDNEEGESVLSKSAARVEETVTGGKYLVEARYGLASIRQTLDVAEKGRTKATVALNAGKLKLLPGPAHPAGAPQRGDTVIAIASADPAGASAPLWIGRDTSAELVVPAGGYDVTISDGTARQTKRTEVKAGETAEYPTALVTGTLVLSALMHDGGGAATDVLYTIEGDDPSAPQGRREVARSAAPNPVFTLEAGTYYVQARLGVARVQERIAVGTGDTVMRTLTFGVAHLALTASLDGAVVPSEYPLVYRVFRKGDDTEVAHSAEREATFDLPAGEYRVEAQLGAMNIKATADMTLAPGAPRTLALALTAGQVTVGSDDRAVASGRWEIRDSRGRIVWRARPGGSRTAILSPGFYRLQPGLAAAANVVNFEVKPGQTSTIEMTAR